MDGSRVGARRARATVLVLVCSAVAFLGLTGCAPKTISASLARSTIEQGGLVDLTGRVDPAAGGVDVAVEQLTGGNWTKVGMTSTDGNGAYRFRIRGSAAGTFSYRARFAKTPSNQVRLVVTPITYLSEMTRAAGSVSTGAYDINGRTYPKAIKIYANYYSSDPGYVEYNLSRAYRRFVAVVGVPDESSSKLRGSWTVKGDGVILRSGTAVLGQAIPLDLDVTGVLRLRLEWTESSGSPGGYLAFGDATLR